MKQVTIKYTGDRYSGEFRIPSPCGTENGACYETGNGFKDNQSALNTACAMWQDIEVSFKFRHCGNN